MLACYGHTLWKKPEYLEVTKNLEWETSTLLYSDVTYQTQASGAATL